MHPQIRRIAVAFVVAVTMAVAGGKVVYAYDSFQTGLDFYTSSRCVGTMATEAWAEAWTADPSTMWAVVSTGSGYEVLQEVHGQGFLYLGPFNYPDGVKRAITMCFRVDTPAWYGTYWDLTYHIS